MGELFGDYKQEGYCRILDKLPTGFYCVEYDNPGKRDHLGRIVFCNQKFAEILGFDDKDDIIDWDVTKSYVASDEGKEYFKRLDEADKKGEALLDYHLRIKRADTGYIVHISIDAHLIKEDGQVVGREGTVRDITEKVEMERKIKETEARLKKVTTDISNLIHTFLHPVLKLSGYADLFRQLGRVLIRSIRYKEVEEVNLQNLSLELKEKLFAMEEDIKMFSGTSEAAAELMPGFQKIINFYDHHLNVAGQNKLMLGQAIRDAALRVLEALLEIGFFEKGAERGELGNVITVEKLEYFEDILFGYFIRTAGVFKGETQVMRRDVEALRRYISQGEIKKKSFRKCDLRSLLEKNIDIFKPMFDQRGIDVESKFTGNLQAMIAEKDIERVIVNLLQNANKYSYKGPGRFITVRAKEIHQQGLVEFSIASFGLPIKKEELESGDIFKFGFRSELAYSADRDGTGVGLADAKEVVDAHSGQILVTSEPLGNDGYPPRYKRPYKTTVTVKLPKTQTR